MGHDDTRRNSPSHSEPHPDPSSRTERKEIGTLQFEVAAARLRHMVAERYLHEALRALEAQAETLELVSRNVARMLAMINRDIGGDSETRIDGPI